MREKNVKILDCTLRDGGRIINCEFQDNTIRGICSHLSRANIDIVEVGFLRGTDLVTYSGNSTFFTEVNQIKEILPDSKGNTKYVAFIDYKMYDFDDLSKCEGDSITGIRVGFTKKQFDTEKEDIRKVLEIVKKQGYDLFIQGVNSLAYSDKELLELIEFVNEIKPYSFGIVDTYGGMYIDDMVHYYNLVEYNLLDDICIDIHAHNNLQSSFAFAQTIISIASSRRKIILDATLDGMGKGAGNLNTELIVDYMSRKLSYDYNTDIILDTIDRYLVNIKSEHFWGYSIPAFMSGIYRAHPNNVIYLTQKYRLNNKDMKHILLGIDEDKRQRYDYDNIQKVYKKYCENQFDDADNIEKLKKIISSNVLIIAPGASAKNKIDKINEYILKENPFVIGVNFMPDNIKCSMIFFANTIHWEKMQGNISFNDCIVTSNIRSNTENAIVVNYSSLIDDSSALYDNSTIMLLNLLKKVGVSKIALAGFDGLSDDKENYIDAFFTNTSNKLSVDRINSEVRQMFNNFKNKNKDNIECIFVTKSLYD